jgi:hypothetical protein
MPRSSDESREGAKSHVLPSGRDTVQEARSAITQAKRDFAGFIEGADQPNITEDQFEWLSYRMSHADDTAAWYAWATDLKDTQPPVDLFGINVWRQDPSFAAIEQIALGNKREGFRLLSVHLAGKALRRLNGMLDSSDPKIVLRALTLWERTMGLLVDKVTLVSKDELQRLTERLMTPVSVTPIEGPSIVEGEWTEKPRLPQPNETSLSS